MNYAEFDVQDFLADKKIINFNARYTGKIQFVDDTSQLKGKVIGLVKYLSRDGKTPLSGPYQYKRSLAVSDVQMANSILLMVKIQSPGVALAGVTPMYVFLRANGYQGVMKDFTLQPQYIHK